MTRISCIVGKVAEPGPTKGQSRPRGKEEMFYSRGQKTVSVSDQTGNILGFAGHTITTAQTVPLRRESIHRRDVSKWAWLGASEM